MQNNHMSLAGKKILLGVTGSIAAYKAVDAVRKLKQLGADVRVIMSAGANIFITPTTLQAVSGNPVFEKLLEFENEADMSHIALARWADLILIAPATAHVIAKLAHGLADDLLTTICLATKSPIMVAPAMNVAMWSNAATQENVSCLKKRNINFLGPDEGVQACGETGEGRMVEVETIVSEVTKFFLPSQRLLNKKVLITAGPTQEAIDPVRFLTNRSSGKMGYAIAKAAALEGADVTLILGPVSLSIAPAIKRVDVSSAKQMHEAVMQHIEKNDVFISAAAVADYYVSNISKSKIKKSEKFMSITLERTPDILSSVTSLKKRPVVVGFAAETDDVIENAKHKLREKNLDMVVANEVGEKKGFDSDYNEVTIITAHDKTVEKLAYSTKERLAKKLVSTLIDKFFTD
jgi:phosphopantothenoylcysteine decarboxylase/phosphopantothenate--cysteine ligase